MKIGWIGLGQMGLPTAKIIAEAGHEVRGYDVQPPEDGKADGVKIVDTVAEAAKDCDLLCIAVFSDKQVEDVLTGPDGVMADLKPGAVVAVFTTGSIEAIQEMAARAPDGVSVLDTCFSRKQSEAQSGALTLLIGGDADAIERVRPALASFSPRIYHVGASGAGRSIKLVNNILFAAHAQVAADALKLAEGLGLERSSTVTALMDCSGTSDVMGNFVESEPGPVLEQFYRYMIKDVNAATQAAQKVNVDLGPLLSATAAYREG
mgnify:CR=1 FL=1